MTKTLYLLRHAKSAHDGDMKDHARPLAPRGIRAGACLARHLAGKLVTVDRVYCSTAKRTRQTFDLVREGMNNPSVSFRDTLYLAPADDLLAFIQAIPDALDHVMLIGHNPGLHDIALSLTSAAARGQAKRLEELREKYPTGGLCTLTFAVKSWKHVATGSGVLAGFVRPKDLDKPPDAVDAA